MIYDDSGDNVPFQMIWNCFCASNCTNCTKLLRFVSISPEIAPLSKFPDQYKHLRYLSFHQCLLKCKRLKKHNTFPMHISDSSKKKYNMAFYILLDVLLADIFSWLIFFILFSCFPCSLNLLLVLPSRVAGWSNFRALKY